MKAEDKPSTSPFDPADSLENGDAILGYLTDALASGDPAFIDDALDLSVRAAKRLGPISATNLRPMIMKPFLLGWTQVLNWVRSCRVLLPDFEPAQFPL